MKKKPGNRVSVPNTRCKSLVVSYIERRPTRHPGIDRFNDPSSNSKIRLEMTMSRKILVKGCLVVWQPAQRDSGCLECRCAGCRKCRGGQHPKRDVFHVAFRALRGMWGCVLGCLQGSRVV